MRITNNMIMGNTKTNINGNKTYVDKYNTQMTTQKKISKASEDPIIAIRSLRLSTTMSHINQYVDNNIPDAQAWMEVTYTALDNMKDLLTDVRSQCVRGATDTLSVDDRNSILKNLDALQDQIYAEGNSDYAGRTVFTGYRTTEKLTFDTDENTTYNITQNFTFDEVKEHRYYQGEAKVPTADDIAKLTDADETNDPTIEDVNKTTNYRIRFAYSGIETLAAEVPTFTDKEGNAVTLVDATGAAIAMDVKTYDSEDAWMESADYPLAADSTSMVFLKSTGELVIPDGIAKNIIEHEYTMTANYTKTSFKENELRPEYYFDCTKNPGQADEVTFTVADQPIKYTVASSAQLTINTQARDVFNYNIDRDITEMKDAIQVAIDAEDKVKRITEMMESEKYADEASQKALQEYKDVAKKELDLANDNVQKLYEKYIGNFDSYLSQTNIAITNLGSMQARLSLTQNRVENQQTTVEDLKSSNEDREMSDIVIDYYAAYNAYTASLTAASKVGQQTLLNYL